MSLLDAFLLEPAPLNLWLAVRDGSNRGCGFASDLRLVQMNSRTGVVNTSYSTGVRFVSCEQALIERNLIDVGSSNQSPIGYASSGVVQTARNQGFDGKAIPGVQFQSNALSQDLAARHSDDLAARVETALLLSQL